MILTQNNFGIYLRYLRKDKDLTVRKLGKLSGISPSYITNVENGKRGTPSPAILKKIAEPLGISYDKLLECAGYWEGLKHDTLLTLDLLDLLRTEPLLYHGHILTIEDKQRISLMLNALFPNYQKS